MGIINTLVACAPLFNKLLKKAPQDINIIKRSEINQLRNERRKHVS